MNTMQEMMAKRNQAWEGAKAFVESKQDKDGLMSEEDAETYAEMEQKVKNYGVEIERLQAMEQMESELLKPMSHPLTTQPMSENKTEQKIIILCYVISIVYIA